MKRISKFVGFASLVVTPIVVLWFLHSSASSADARSVQPNAIEQVDSVGGAVHVSSSKNIDWKWMKRFERFSNSLSKEQHELHEDFKHGDWQKTLDLANRLKAKFAEAGYDDVSFSLEREEAYIGLGFPEQALSLFDPKPQRPVRARNLTYALALAMTGRLHDDSARVIASMCSSYADDLGPDFIRTPKTRNEKIALVRTARALGQPEDEVAIREAHEALRLDPSQQLAAYVLAGALGRRKMYAESLKNWRIASTIPGKWGEYAKKMADSTEYYIDQEARKHGSGGN